ncbi:hypothetical protein [Weissella viridescens]|uniref:hypothetical protein n=1 Tax=Weissella viridescens TaxID=1629 RepID=UPI0025769C25|nr:hypothetical protein [Weissella viridescens]WJI90708.1 hypothetical protein PWA48_05165 [Weissella viridescens]
MTLYANTTAYANPNGSIATGIYTQAELEQLAAITHGSQYSGNTDLDRVATEHTYRNGYGNYMNLVGPDGVLKLYNDSKFLPKEAETAVAGFWNNLAGTEIVRFVDLIETSDETIHDVYGEVGALAAQTYNGNGLIFYPDTWQTTHLTWQQKENWHVTALLHEIGHALGVSHLGGGADGSNAGTSGHFGSEIMGPWDVRDNLNGAISTKIDAAALAMAALTWRKPRKVATWVLQNDADKYQARYDNRQIYANMPFVSEPDDGWGILYENFMIQSKVVTYRTINKDYKLYQFEERQLDGKSLVKAKLVGSTADSKHHLLGKVVQIMAVYPTDVEGQRVVRFKQDGEELTVLEAALDKAV